MLVNGGTEFDIRAMCVDFGLGWVGWWGYALAYFWLPIAALRIYRSQRMESAPLRSEWLLVVLLPLSMAAASAIVHLTPLRDATINLVIP